MKKILLLLMSALLLFSAACSGGSISPGGRAYNARTDDDYYLSASNQLYPVVETENGFYFLTGSFLFYADVDTMAPIPVCAKPNCRHYEETDYDKLLDCGAYFQQSMTGGSLSYVDGQLYVFHRASHSGSGTDSASLRGYTLTQVSADGTQRKNLISLIHPFPGKNLIHRGRFYIVTQETDQAGLTTAKLWSYSLDKPGEEPQLLYQTEPSEITHNLFSWMCAYTDYLYWTEFTQDRNRNRLLSLRILNLNTGELTVQELQEGYTVGQAAIAGGNLLATCSQIGASAIYQAGSEKPDLSAPLLISSPDGTGTKEIAFASWGATTADEDYIYLTSPKSNEQQADGSYISSVPTDSIRFCDPEMNLIDELPFEQLALPGTKLSAVCIYPTQREKVLLHASYGYDEVFYYFDRAQIGTGEITPVEFWRFRYHDYLFTNT